MRQSILIPLCIAGSLVLSACARDEGAEAKKTLKDLNVIDESNLNDVMLQSSDPNEAVAYFTKAVADNPDRADLKRDLAQAYIRANKPMEAATVWKSFAFGPGGTNEDRVGLASAQIRNNDWKSAKATLNQIPPTYESYERYRLEAMLADSEHNWKKADSFYETAFGMTTRPAGLLNNWGFSKLSRGDYAGAEKLFSQSLKYDTSLFTAKNNLVLARAAQRKYDMPIVPMNQTEKAQLLYTAGLAAIKKGDVNTGRTLLQDAIDTNPQYFEEATRALQTLDANVTKG